MNNLLATVNKADCIDKPTKMKVEYNEVAGLISKLEPDTLVDIRFKRGEMVIDKSQISPQEVKSFLDEWLCPNGRSSYCEGSHSINTEDGIEKHVIKLEYGTCKEYSILSRENEPPFERAKITYSLKK